MSCSHSPSNGQWYILPRAPDSSFAKGSLTNQFVTSLITTPQLHASYLRYSNPLVLHTTANFEAMCLRI